MANQQNPMPHQQGLKHCTKSEGDNYFETNSRIFETPTQNKQKNAVEMYRKNMAEIKLQHPEEGKFLLKRGRYQNDCWLPYTYTRNVTLQGPVKDMNQVAQLLKIYKNELARDARLQFRNKANEESDRELLEALNEETTSA